MSAVVSRAGAIAILLLMLSAGGVAAQEPVMRIDWNERPPTSGEVIEGNVRVSGDGAGGTIPLITIKVPDLGREGYVIRGRVRYTDVEGSGYLEMWNVFADGGRYFTRTLGADGSMAVLAGTSDWRPFELPFFLQGAAPPSQLEINVVLPGSGSVEVGPLELVRLDETGSGAWLTDRTIGVVGAALGTTIGLFGAIVGTLVSRNRGRRFVLPAMTAATIVGVALVVGSIAAVPAGQPPSVVFLLFVPGVVLAAVFGLAIPRVRRAYADAELRRMRAMDHV
jgi:hypothetical protein